MQRNGTFVECSEPDSSASLLLEKQFNWSGVVIEPNPELFNRLIRSNRDAWLVPTCLTSGPSPYTVKFPKNTKISIFAIFRPRHLWANTKFSVCRWRRFCWLRAQRKSTSSTWPSADENSPCWPLATSNNFPSRQIYLYIFKAQNFHFLNLGHHGQLQSFPRVKNADQEFHGRKWLQFVSNQGRRLVSRQLPVRQQSTIELLYCQDFCAIYYTITTLN